MLYYNQSAEELLERFRTSVDVGLTMAEVEKRQAEYGRNAIKMKATPLWRRLLEPFMDVFMIVLILAVTLSLINGDVLDSIIIGVIIVVNATIDYVQQFSTERILRSLRRQSTQKVGVVRDGEKALIDASELVPGDIVQLSEGDKIPADGRILVANGVRVDESLLTGESLPVSKNSHKLAGDREVYERTNLLFAESYLVSGEVKMLVIRIGNETEYGRIADLAGSIEPLSPVQAKIGKLVSEIAVVVGLMSVVVFALEIYRGIGWLESLEFVMALAVSAVPEGLPIAISIVLALGMRRMAKKKALVAHMQAIQTIGVITTIATDKTGTLTENKLSVKDTWKLPGTRGSLERAMALAIVSPTESKDPLDTAIVEYTKKAGVGLIETEPVKILPFDQGLAISGNMWHEGENLSLYIKGAPERLIEKSNLTENEREECMSVLQKFASDGYRVLAIAKSLLKEKDDLRSGAMKKHRFEMLGLIAVADSLRKESKTAVAEAKHAGVTVRMITGDHFETAYSIGKELGITKAREEVFDCRRMELIPDDELKRIVERTKVFARVVPESKFKILSILKENEIAAMTGDGVNDVPALVNAHVGVAMGSGSEIARDAGDIVLLNDNFKNIVEAMREGRIIMANVRRMLMYLLSTNAGEALTMIGALVIGSSLPLVPVQILWVNLITDSLMVIPLGLEGAEENVMKEKPEKADAPILDKRTIIRMALVAVTIAVVTLGVHRYYLSTSGEEIARSLAFMALVVTQLANAFNARSNYQSVFVKLRKPNKKLYVGVIAAVGLQALVFFGPLREVLHVASVSAVDLAVVCAISFAAPIFIVEMHKLFVLLVEKYARKA